MEDILEQRSQLIIIQGTVLILSVTSFMFIHVSIRLLRVHHLLVYSFA